MSPGQDRSSPWSAACGVGESLLGLGNSVMWPRATNCYTPHTRTYTPHTHARRWMHAGKPPLCANDRHGHRHRHRHRQQAPSTNQANTRTHTHTHTPSTGKLKNKYVQYLTSAVHSRVPPHPNMARIRAQSALYEPNVAFCPPFPLPAPSIHPLPAAAVAAAATAASSNPKFYFLNSPNMLSSLHPRPAPPAPAPAPAHLHPVRTAQGSGDARVPLVTNRGLCGLEVEVHVFACIHLRKYFAGVGRSYKP